MFNGSHVIKGRWKIVKKIGQGAFGEIYQAKNVFSNEMVAIKVEKVDSKKQVLKMEVVVLKKLQDSPYVCRFITCGRFSDYNYMVMELLGENLSELRRKQPEGKFSLSTTIKLGQQMLRAIEAVHELGYLHRDVKPSNFAMGLSSSKRKVAFLIDFGLARRYVLSNGDVRPARDSAGFRGTARYASINSHQSKDLGRLDDLWSLFYVLIEFSHGSLPWRRLKDKDQIGEMKMRTTPAELIGALPQELYLFMQYLESLEYKDKPDYKYLQTLLLDMYHKLPSSDAEVEIESSNKKDKVGSPEKSIRVPKSSSGSRNSKYAQVQDDQDLEAEEDVKKSSDGSKKEEEDMMICDEAEKKILPEKKPQILLRQTIQDYNIYRNSFTGITGSFADFGGFKTIVSINPNKQAYVSSNMDENGSVPNKTQHRRSYSLPVTLSGNFAADGNANGDPTNGGTSGLKSPFRTHRQSPSISIPFQKSNRSKSKAEMLNIAEEISISKENVVSLSDKHSTLSKEDKVDTVSNNDVQVEAIDVEDGKPDSKSKKKRATKTDSNSKLRPRGRFGSLREKERGGCCKHQCSIM